MLVNCARWWLRAFALNSVLVVCLSGLAAFDSCHPFSDEEIAAGAPEDTYGVQEIVTWVVLPILGVSGIGALTLAALASGARRRALAILQVAILMATAALILVTLKRLERRVLPASSATLAKVTSSGVRCCINTCVLWAAPSASNTGQRCGT